MKVEIWSDVVCPWSYIGKRRFERAVASFSHPGEVTVTYRSFELDPDAPAQRTATHAEHLARKYGMTIAEAEQANQQMIQRAAAEGLQFRFDLIRGGILRRRRQVRGQRCPAARGAPGASAACLRRRKPAHARCRHGRQAGKRETGAVYQLIAATAPAREATGSAGAFRAEQPTNG